MTQPADRPPDAPDAPVDPVDEHDPEAAEEYAESVPIDPSPDQVNHYLTMVGDRNAEPEDEGEPEDAGEPGQE